MSENNQPEQFALFAEDGTAAPWVEEPAVAQPAKSAAAAPDQTVDEPTREPAPKAAKSSAQEVPASAGEAQVMRGEEGHVAATAPAISDGKAVTRNAPQLPLSTAADAHIIVATATGTATPSGGRLTGPVDSVDKLAALIDWAMAQQLLQPGGGSPQIWIMGLEACALLGWVIDIDEIDGETDREVREQACTLLEQTITPTLDMLLTQGWELRGRAGHRVHLTRILGGSSRTVDVILEPYVWTISRTIDDYGILGREGKSTSLPDEDIDAARELGRRVAWCVEHLGVVPGNTAARTGAAIADSIARPRKRTNKGKAGKPNATLAAVADLAGPVPPVAGLLTPEVEPVALWARKVDDSDMADVTHLVTIDQRASYLASAGMLNLGYGRAELVSYAEDQARENKRPFGLWEVTLPARSTLSVPEKMPAPHPHMQRDKAVTTWVTTESLNGLTAPIEDGGAGLEVDDLAVGQAWLWPQQGRLLEAWATRLRKARKLAVETDDEVMKKFVDAIYKGYVGRMKNAERWQHASMAHHHQPVWRAAIMASCRWRGRRAAMKIAAETGRWPLSTNTDSWVYALGDGQDIADTTGSLGRMALEKYAALDEQSMLELRAPEDAAGVRKAIATIYRETAEDMEEVE